MEDFNTGFSEKSYFNILKQFVVGFYDNVSGDGALDFKYHDDMEINAYASYDSIKHGDILRMNVGSVVEIFSMMKTAFSQNDIMQVFGNPSMEKNVEIDGKFLGFDCMIVYSGDVQDEIRRTISDYTALFALRFIFAHEMGHILNGHTKLLKSLYMDSKIQMRLENIFRGRKYALDRRTLEMDADASAATSSIDNIIMLYCKNRNDYIFSIIPDPEDIFSLWSFAISCVFFMFERLHTTDYREKSYYLPNEARFTMVLDSAYRTAESYVSHGIVDGLVENKEKILKAVNYGIEQARLFFRKVYYVNFPWLIIIDEEEKFEWYSNEVLDNWNNRMYKMLEKYSRAPLYIPSKVDEIMEELKIKWGKE